MNDDRIHAAQQLVTQLAEGDFAAVEQSLEDGIRQQLPADRQRTIWQGLLAQVGAFKEQVKLHTFQAPSNEFIIVTCAFERANLDINFSFSNAGKVNSLTITPVGGIEQQFTAHYELPPYAYAENFKEQQVQIGQSEWVLPGTLSLPTGDGPFPAVVLVHGSGPQDRDETIGPNKPFRDLAWGLATQGIAVLRYEKRTKAYSSEMKNLADAITVKEEVIDDALAAVALLRDNPKVNPRQIFVLGHSLGGYLLPRIGAMDPRIAGLIALAGSARPFEDIVLEQYTYIFSLSGTLTAEQEQHLEQLKKQVARVKDPNLSLTTPASELPLGVAPAYWLDLRGYQPAEMARGLKQPMLILQAESDYQVTMEDYSIWKSALATRGNVQFKSYPGLHHLFMLVEGGKATPAVYAVLGHVAEEVVNDIARWIKEQ
ncbi:MAG TPA: alpha/beta fold hydrolase [Ktedonobacteraceae bacterium]|nr:alpha/beta fold hydrolase [Ktedonobacteraceae bacterium]